MCMWLRHMAVERALHGWRRSAALETHSHPPHPLNALQIPPPQPATLTAVGGGIAEPCTCVILATAELGDATQAARSPGCSAVLIGAVTQLAIAVLTPAIDKGARPACGA